MSKISELIFIEDTHSYFLGTVPIPSVSEIIKPIYQKVYGKIDKETLEIAADRGTRVHRAIEFISKHDLCCIDQDISGFIEAYKKFRKDYENWKLQHSEFKTYYRSLLYVMTIDQIYETPKGTVILDIKTTKVAHPKSWSVQLSTYKYGFESQHKKVAKMSALQLFEDGNYRLHELKDNFSIFLPCLKIHVSNQSELSEVAEILKGVKQHHKEITEYWKTAKVAANQAYMEIRKKGTGNAEILRSN